MPSKSADPATGLYGLVRRLGLFDATMLVMGGIIGSGIFVTPAEVAQHVDTPLLIVGVWILGGLVALAASFVYAELAARRPEVGGQYAYLRDAYGPMPAFLYGGDTISNGTPLILARGTPANRQIPSGLIDCVML